jgi:acylphosphatase
MSENKKDHDLSRCIRVTVIGRVQGVGFRYFTQGVAHRYGLTGWVRNNFDGTVGILAEGSEKNLNAFLKAISRGPSSSHVQKVKVKWLTQQSNYSTFGIRT